MERCGHVFLVGLPRSGTTLISAVLNSSDDIGISIFESHFLSGTHGTGSVARTSFRDQIKKIGHLETDEGARRIVDYIYDRPEPFWRQVVSQVDREEFLRRLMQSDRTDRDLFELGMRINAAGKPVCGEKTPGHIRQVPTLLKWFPDAKIAHILRDPRATFVSQRKKRGAKNRGWPTPQGRWAALLYELYQSTMFIVGWRRILRLDAEYRAVYPDRYCLVRYEDLVSNPETTLRDLCAFLGCKFSMAMLTDQVNINSSYAGVRQATGFDKHAIGRWRAHMHPLIRQWFNLWCRISDGQYGYLP